MKSLLFLSLLILLTACTSSVNDQDIDRTIENLTAFARVYGHVKYFHPSDEAMEVDWDKFAIHGVKTLNDSHNDRDLKEKLEVLFSPIAPTVSIHNSKPSEDHFLSAYLEMIGTDTTGLKTVAWQHNGVYLGVDHQPYRSSRTNRNDFNLNRAISIVQNLDEDLLRGKKLRIRNSARSNPDHGDGQVELIIFTDNQNIFNQTINVIDDEWVSGEVQTDINDNTVSVIVGFQIQGNVDIILDEVSVEYKTESTDWTTYPIKNNNFADMTGNSPANWEVRKMGFFEFENYTEDAESDENLLRIASRPKLFDHFPTVGETAIQQISDQLWSEVPLALFSNDEYTMPLIRSSEIEKQSFSRYKEQIDQINTNPISMEDKNLQLANIIITWNVFQHFYPYFDVVDADWDGVLKEALERVIRGQTVYHYRETLDWMIAQLQDGHGVVTCGDDVSIYKPAIRVDKLEGEIVVTSSTSEDITVGEIIKSVDGRPAMEELESKMALISGSPQLSEYRALNLIASGKSGSWVNLQIQNSAGELRTKEVLRSESANLFRSRIEFDYPEIHELENDIYLINLSKITQRSFESKIDDLSSARGIIYDYRNGSNSSFSLFDIIPYLTNEVVKSPNWHIPKWAYPDRQNVQYDHSTQSFNPKEPQLKGVQVVLNVPSVVSSGETVMGIIDHYQLASTVGQSTAGTNGNSNYINLPGNCRIMWTGMKVLKHDNTQLHLYGYEPDYLVERTINAVRVNRDEFLDKAIEIIHSNDN